MDSLHFCNSGPLALMASGRDTGLVVDIGDGATQITPIFQGQIVKDVSTVGPIAGSHIGKYL